MASRRTVSGQRAGTGGQGGALQQALALYQGGRLDEAERICRSVLRASPRSPDALNLLGMTVYQRGRREEGVELIADAATARPEIAAYHMNLGFALAELGRHDGAAEAYRRALAAAPGNADALGNLGLALQRQGRYDEALEAYRRLLATHPGHVGALVSIGTALRDQGRLQEAEAPLREALERQPDFAPALANLAAVLQEQGRLDEALAVYERTVARHPDFLDARINYGHALKELGRTAEARGHYASAVAIDPANAEAQYSLGALLQATGDLGGAIACFEAALAADPTHVRSYWGAQECALLAARPDDALAFCDACAGRFPDNQMTIANRAFAELARGRADRFDYIYDLAFFPYAARLTPPGDHGDLAAFNRALAADVLAHDSLRWQHDDYDTSRRAFAYGILERPTPAIRAFERALRAAIDAFIGGIAADPAHPFFGRVPRAYDFKMWATVLERGGWHRPHNHEEAWLSGVYYVQVPPAEGAERSGWIRFDGFTRFPGTAAHAGKVREVRPEEGLLLFFPAYFLHATNPFAGGTHRISLAFDAQPRG